MKKFKFSIQEDFDIISKPNIAKLGTGQNVGRALGNLAKSSHPNVFQKVSAP